MLETVSLALLASAIIIGIGRCPPLMLMVFTSPQVLPNCSATKAHRLRASSMALPEPGAAGALRLNRRTGVHSGGIEGQPCGPAPAEGSEAQGSRWKS